jgi:ribonuclease HI
MPFGLKNEGATY